VLLRWDVLRCCLIGLHLCVLLLPCWYDIIDFVDYRNEKFRKPEFKIIILRLKIVFKNHDLFLKDQNYFERMAQLRYTVGRWWCGFERVEIVCVISGRSLSSLSSSQIILNPDLSESHRLRGWYDSIGSSASYSEYRREGDSSVMASGLFHGWHRLFMLDFMLFD